MNAAVVDEYRHHRDCDEDESRYDRIFRAGADTANAMTACATPAEASAESD